MFAVALTIACVSYLVAFAGVPLVLSVMSSPEKEKEAFESALRNANVMDEEELRALHAASYVPWSKKEAAAVAQLTAGSSSPVKASPYGLRQRKTVA